MKTLMQKMMALMTMLMLPTEKRNAADEEKLFGEIKTLMNDSDFNPSDNGKLLEQFDQLKADVESHAGLIKNIQSATLLTPSIGHVRGIGDADAPQQRFSSPQMAKEFAEHLVKSYKAANGDADARKDLGMAGPDGGYLIPNPAISEEIWQMVSSVGAALEIAHVIPCGAGGLETTIGTQGATAHWKKAGEAGTESTPQFAKDRLSPETLIALIDAPGELEEDAMIALGNYVASEMAYAIHCEIDRVAFQGTGIASDGGIVGILNSDRVTRVAMADGNTAFSDISTDDIFNVEAAIAEAAEQNGRWLMNKTILAEIKKLKDASNLPVWQGLSSNEPSNIIGYPYKLSAKMRGMSASAAGTGFLALGDFRKGMTIAHRGAIRVDFSNIPGFKSFVSSFRAIYRVDIGIRGYTTVELAANETLENPIAVLETAEG